MLEVKQEVWSYGEGWDVFEWLWEQEGQGWKWKPPAVDLPDGSQQFCFERSIGNPRAAA